jgi:hypothetical protein
MIPAVVGLIPLVTGHLEYTVKGGRVTIDGAPARALGLAALALGACLHVHFFWQRHEGLSEYGQPVLVASALVMLGSLGCALYWLSG